MSDQTRVSFEAPSTFAGLAQIRQAIQSAAQAHQINRLKIYQTLVAVEESCSNIIRHASAARCARPLSFDVEASIRQMTVLIKDVGIPFDLVSYPSSDAAALALRNRSREGYGIHLIKSLVDRYEYVTNGKGETHLLLTKFFEA